MHRLTLLTLLFTSGLVRGSSSFAFESLRLTESDARAFPAVEFASTRPRRGEHHNGAPCRAFPGSEDWPLDADWEQLNSTLGGALLRPSLTPAVCYPGEHYDADRCSFLVREAGRNAFWFSDPLSVFSQWPQGSTCMPNLTAVGECTRGAFPEYVVNATTVKHIQAAVNFARNKNVRLIIK